MDNWDELRTAFHVARHGTVSGAAESLGVHHATVIRHIDSLETRLGVKLFQRHARGYTPTEAGEDLARVVSDADGNFQQLAARLSGAGEEIRGELLVTTLDEFTDMLVPVMVRFRQANPSVVVRLLTGDRLFRLEYGEAHIALRAGSPPQEPDNVVQPFGHEEIALFAAPQYLESHGTPTQDADLADHLFVGQDDPDNRAPFERWLRGRVPRDQVVFRAASERVMADAIALGAGLGFLSLRRAKSFPDLVQVMPPREEWRSPLWLVTHVDLHRMPKVQAFLAMLKSSAGGD